MHPRNDTTTDEHLQRGGPADAPEQPNGSRHEPPRPEPAPADGQPAHPDRSGRPESTSAAPSVTGSGADPNYHPTPTGDDEPIGRSGATRADEADLAPARNPAADSERRVEETGAGMAGAEASSAELRPTEAMEAGAATGAGAVPEPAAMPTSREFTLVPDGDSESLRRRWWDVQAGFVDDPRETVRQASELVDEAVRVVTVRLSERWQTIGEDHGDAATEQLRQVLRRYRALFEGVLEL